MAITVSGIGFLKDFIYVIICKLFSVKIVYHFHNKGIRDNNSTLFKFFYKHAFNNQFAIVLSEKLKFDIVDFFKSDNIFICPNGMSNINISNVEKFESDKDSISLLFISNLLISKGILDLIEACNLLKLNGIKFTCNIIGAEKELNSLQLTHLIKKFDLFDCVRYVGAKYDLDKYKYLNSADILIYPSYSDCLPLVLIEALQFSLPIISTDEGAISDLVIDNFNGFIVEKKSPHSIFQKIVIYKNEFYSNYTLNYNSRDLYLSKYTLECFNLNLKQVIDKIMYE
jgi:glycosyltransferase involved in cell wall biosynthesis